MPQPLCKTEIRQLKHRSSYIINHLVVRRYTRSCSYLYIYLTGKTPIHRKFSTIWWGEETAHASIQHSFSHQIPRTRFTALRLNQWWHITDFDLPANRISFLCVMLYICVCVCVCDLSGVQNKKWVNCGWWHGLGSVFIRTARLCIFNFNLFGKLLVVV